MAIKTRPISTTRKWSATVQISAVIMSDQDQTTTTGASATVILIGLPPVTRFSTSRTRHWRELKPTPDAQNIASKTSAAFPGSLTLESALEWMRMECGRVSLSRSLLADPRLYQPTGNPWRRRS
jgi:hypothetical protein